MKKYNLYILAVLPKSSFQCFIPLDFNRFCSVSGIPSHCFCVCLEGPFYTSLSFTDEITRYGSFCRFLHRPRHPSPVYSLCSFFKCIKWKKLFFWQVVLNGYHLQTSPLKKGLHFSIPFLLLFFLHKQILFFGIFWDFFSKILTVFHFCKFHRDGEWWYRPPNLSVVIFLKNIFFSLKNL